VKPGTRARTRPRRPYRPPAADSSPARSLDPIRAAALRELAEAQLGSRTPEGAADVLRQAVVLDAASGQARLALACGLYRLGDFDGALAWLGQADAGAEGAVLRGRVLADRREFEAAERAFSRALELAPGQAEALMRRASVRLARGLSEPALDDLDALLSRGDPSEAARLLRAAAHLEAGQPALALADLAALPAPPPGSAWLLLRTRALAQSGASEEEVDRVFLEGLERLPQDAALRLAVARRLAQRRPLLPEAAERARGLLAPLDGPAGQARAPDSLRAQALFVLAELAAEVDDDPGRAEAFYLQGLKLLPDDLAGLGGLARLLIDRGRPARAMPWLIRALLIAPGRPSSQEILARALARLTDDEAVDRWLGLLLAGLAGEAPRLLTQLLRFTHEAGRNQAYDDVQREAHRMKNRIAVLATRAQLASAAEPAGDGLQARLEALYAEWVRFLESIRDRPAAPGLVGPARLVRLAIERVGPTPDGVEINLPARLPFLRGDEEQLAEALASVLTNALEASPPGRPVRLEARAAEGEPWLELLVTDEGPGIPTEDRLRIFEPGYTGKEQGTGLGLAIARRAVHAHGGRLSLATASGGPTTFTLRLPLALPAGPEPGLPFAELALERLEAGRRAPPARGARR
jgi:signal transduction histidine kinase